MKTKYDAWVSNSSGASEDIKHRGNTSVRRILDYVRANYGRGWRVTIADQGQVIKSVFLR